MPKPTGKIIASIIWIIWVGALEVKKMLPGILGSFWFQMSCATIVAILIPIGTLIALRRFSIPRWRRSGLALLVVCVFPLVFNLTAYGVGGPMRARLVVTFSSMNDRDLEMIAKLTRQAVEPEQFKQRKKAAWALYRLFGVRSVWCDNSGSLANYNPSGQEEASWQKEKKIKLDLTATTKLLDDQLKQFPLLFAVNFGCFVVILFGGLVWQTFHRTNDPTGDGESDGTALV